ncbi:MAG: hypothetical protein JW940_33430 [Polyangiaceae bacterium]|nr:hypothetical protein [Polyangiaceae bacterium]
MAPPPGPASTPPATQTATEKPPDTRRSLGLGYKIGNGIGFLGGDVIIAPIDHVALDFQASYATWGDATGYGLAPALQLQLNPGPKSTPYLGVGLQYAHMTLDNVTGSGTGFFANLGYEWRSASGLGLLLGGGVQYLQEVSATDGTTTITAGGEAHVNLEVGVRYMFI